MAPLLTPTSNTPTPGSASAGLGSKLKILVPLLLLIIGFGVGLRYWNYRSRPTDIALSGRIEGHETDLAAKASGRVVKISVEEGDRVQTGTVVARLEDAQLQAQLAAAKAQVGGSPTAGEPGPITGGGGDQPDWGSSPRSAAVSGRQQWSD